MSKQCKIVQDLLPLYVDKVSSDESNELIEAHLKECDECNKVLNILKNEEKVSNVDEKDAIKRFNKKLKRKNLKIIIITILIIILVTFLGWRLLYVNETTVKYEDNLVNVEIPEDEGIDIYINAKNYKNGYAILVKTGENTYDVYVNITQNIFTKLQKVFEKWLTTATKMIILKESVVADSNIHNKQKGANQDETKQPSRRSRILLLAYESRADGSKAK